MGVSVSSGSKRLHPARAKRNRLGRLTIVVCQNALLWTALYVIASTIFILVIGAVDAQAIPSAVMYLVAGILSLSYLLLQTIATHLRTRARSMIDGERVDAHRSLAAHTLPILVTIWMVASGLCITFTAARQPLCTSGRISAKTAVVDQGRTCIINRITILTGLVGMIATTILFLLIRQVTGANRCHLLGMVPEHKLLPLFLAHKDRGLRTMPSEMSFKCRSSTSISTRALAAEHTEHNPMPQSFRSSLASTSTTIIILNTVSHKHAAPAAAIFTTTTTTRLPSESPARGKHNAQSHLSTSLIFPPNTSPTYPTRPKRRHSQPPRTTSSSPLLSQPRRPFPKTSFLLQHLQPRHNRRIANPTKTQPSTLPHLKQQSQKQPQFQLRQQEQHLNNPTHLPPQNSISTRNIPTTIQNELRLLDR
ncbi:hypothetical protein BST61_g5529 [Cercospora zeina]